MALLLVDRNTSTFALEPCFVYGAIQQYTIRLYNSGRRCPPKSTIQSFFLFLFLRDTNKGAR